MSGLKTLFIRAVCLEVFYQGDYIKRLFVGAGLSSVCLSGRVYEEVVCQGGFIKELFTSFLAVFTICRLSVKVLEMVGCLPL